MGLGHDVLNLEQVATLLGRDARELGKLASRGHLPGRKVGGAWRFAAADIHHWVERQLPDWSDQEHGGLDPICPVSGITPFITTLIPVECIELEFPARTKKSVIRELVKLAGRSGAIANVTAIREAVETREAKASTAWPGGFATPHPHRRLPAALNEAVIAVARAPGGIPFGADLGGLTDLFFLVCCTDDLQHLQVLSRLSRMLRKPGFADEIRSAETAQGVRRLLESAELDLSN